MLEQKLEWIGSKCTMLEERGMIEQYMEHDLARIMANHWHEWQVSHDDQYVPRLFRQEYYKLWLTRKRYGLSWDVEHMELCKAWV